MNYKNIVWVSGREYDLPANIIDSLNKADVIYPCNEHECFHINPELGEENGIKLVLGALVW